MKQCQKVGQDLHLLLLGQKIESLRNSDSIRQDQGTLASIFSTCTCLQSKCNKQVYNLHFSPPSLYHRICKITHTPSRTDVFREFLLLTDSSSWKKPASWRRGHCLRDPGPKRLCQRNPGPTTSTGDRPASRHPEGIPEHKMTSLVFTILILVSYRKQHNSSGQIGILICHTANWC